MERSTNGAVVLWILAVPCVSFGPLFMALGAGTRPVLEHSLLMAGAVMIGAGLSALFILALKIERRIAALQEQITSARE